MKKKIAEWWWVPAVFGMVVGVFILLGILEYAGITAPDCPTTTTVTTIDGHITRVDKTTCYR